MRKFRIVAVLAVCLGVGLLVASSAQADNFSFTGNFTQDDNVQLFHFTVGAASNVVLRTWSYAGGTNAAGQAIAEGGFDPILALFDGTGALVNTNDDGSSSEVSPDSVSGLSFDTYFAQSNLAADNYTVSVMEYDNSAIGPNLSDGFSESGNGNFTVADYAGPATTPGCTQFIDIGGHCRDSHWAFDVDGVEAASTPPPTTTPEPANAVLFGTGLLGLLGVGVLKRRHAAAL